MRVVKQIIDFIGILVPMIFRKKNPKEVKEFTDLVKEQYDYLMEHIKKFQTDYFELSEEVKRMCRESVELNKQLKEALKLQCLREECKDRG